MILAARTSGDGGAKAQTAGMGKVLPTAVVCDSMQPNQRANSGNDCVITRGE